LSGYLRDIQLRKQLEEKVKEATKNRQQAEKELSEATEVITAAKGIDATTTEAETALAEATSAMSGKDYKLGLEKAIEAKQKGKRAYAERVAAIVESSEVLMNLARSMGAGIAEGETSINKAKEALAKEDYESALDFANKGWKRFEKIVHEHLSKQFSSAQSLIMAAKNMGKETGPVEDLLSRARSAVESNDFELALSYTNECLEAVQSELVEEVARATSEVDVLMKTAQDLGVDVIKVSTLMNRARVDAEKREFQKAINSLKQAKAEGEKAIQKGLESRFLEVRKLMEAATEIGADIDKGKSFLDRAISALQQGNFQQASDLGKQAVQEIQTAQFQRVLFTIAQSRDKFVAAKGVGADITPAVDLLNRARQALQKGSFSEALGYAKQAEEMVDGSLGQFRQVEALVKEIGTDFIQAEALGVNVSNARRFLERAKKDLTARDFTSALEEVRKAKEELARSEYERTMEVMEQSEFIMTLGERMGANLEEAGKLLEDCIVATKEKEYRKAIELAQGASQSAETAIKSQLTDTLAQLRGSMGFLAEDAASVRSLVDKAEGAMAAKDYDGALTFVTEARKVSEGRTKTKSEEFHATLKSAVELVAELGAPVGSLAETFKEVDAALARFDYTKVVALRQKGVDDLTAIAETVFNLVKDRVVEARNLRMNIDELLQTLKRSRMALSIGDLSEAFRLMGECNRKTAKLVSMHKETYNAISSAAALVAEAKKKDVDVTTVLEMLLEGKKAFEALDYDRALELSRRAKSETEKLMILYSSAQNIIATKEKLETAVTLGIDTATLKDNLETAKEAMRSKSYEEALAVSTKVQQAVDELLENRISSLISQSESILETIKDVALAEQREKIARAKELLEKRDWSEAGTLAVSAREDLEQSVKRKEEAGVAIRKCQDAFSEVEALNIETPDARKLLEKAERLAKAGSFDDALAAADQAAAELERERDLSIGKTIDKFQDAIAKAKREGIDTRTADKLLEKARQQFRDKKFRQALQMAMQSEAEAERIGLQQDMAAKAIMTVEKKLKGFGSPMPDVQNLVTGAQRAFEEGDYVKALDLAIRAGDGFNKHRELLEETQEIRSKAEKITKAAFQIGADAEKLDRILKEATSAFDAGDAKSARDAYQQCVEWGLGACTSHLEKLRSQAASFIDELKSLELDTTQTAKRLSESKAHIDSENFEIAFNVLQEAKRGAQELMTQKVTAALTASQEAIDHAKSLRADVAEAENILQDGRDALEQGQYEKALRLIKESTNRVESRRESERKFVDFSYKADSTIRNARKFGIEVLEAEKTLAEALKIKKTDIDKAIEIAASAYKLALDAVEAFAPKMEVSLDVPNAVAGQEVDATLTLVNVGRALAKDLKVKILGDVEVAGLQDIPNLKAKGETKLPLKVKMTATGSVPLALQMVSHRVLDGKEYQQEIIAQIDVLEKPAEPPKPTLAEKEGRCPVCKGSIKVGFKIARCQQCAAELHEMCAARVGKCPVCGSPISVPGAQKQP